MIVRRYIRGLEIEGLDVAVDGLSMTIKAGTITTPQGVGQLVEDTTLNFPTSSYISDINIGFDLLGRLYVHRFDRGQELQDDNATYGTLTHYIYFTLNPDDTDLNNVLINVIYSAPS